MISRILVCLTFLSLAACNGDREPSVAQGKFSVPFEKFELENGLDVVLHVDESDPVVAVALTAHVGSAREKEGRTGFAHLFEHLLFLESENLGKGGLDAMSARIGGSGANGSTSRDRTNYFQTVPQDALEKMIWAEADKLGYFINTVTEPVLAKEKQVVKNEKRQGVDNRPYGHTRYVIDKALYPADHPYNWQVIGSLEDLDAATLPDVKEFFRRWYVPNNVTLTISGNFDPVEVKRLVKKYFDEIPRGEAVERMDLAPVTLATTKKLYHEDNFARLPELTMAWPTVEQYNSDGYALDVLLDYLSNGKRAPLYKVIVEQKELAANVQAYNYGSELAGTAYISVRAFPDTPLDTVAAAIVEGFKRFETAGISEKDLDRIKAGQETNFYNGLSSVLGKGFNLAQYNIFAGDPGFVEQDIENILAVTTADVMRVYDQYLKGQPFVATSFVPKGQTDLILTGSTKADVVEEPIEQGAEEEFDAGIAAEYERTASSFDRAAEPNYGAEISTVPPTVWTEELANGVTVRGIENNEVPLINFNLAIPGGQLNETLGKAGVANLMATLLTKGTKNKSPEELEDAIQQLGARINVYATGTDIRVSGNTLARNYPATIALLTEIMLEPRWDEEELAIARRGVLSRIEQNAASPNAIADKAFDELLYGEDNIRAYSRLGTAETVANITMDDLKDYYESFISPSEANLNVVGALNQADVLAPFDRLTDGWSARETTAPQWPLAREIDAAKVYFYDVPGAKQSVLYVGNPSLAATDRDYYPTQIMNYILGGGGFASRLTQELREGKGYTYGINSGFNGGKETGVFAISTSVRSNVTLESAQAIKQILEAYPETFSEQDLETTRSYLTKSNARAFETAGAKLGLLDDMAEYGWSADYVREREDVVRNTEVEDVKRIANQYLRPEKMIWLVVGDAATQLGRMRELGYGEVVLLE
ncbi:M16 family metallopeptidase [Neolewinella antarctica]|uniref:Zinc protease n=1 Tax=Neolewinella antarctica TaxID=442734 RepID=A0ABX0XEK2_9BACT|nr:pitrilysin family protein [Neolewinella antarctica]NJC27745.1 zinc protease [Neolewinella antarctica]